MLTSVAATLCKELCKAYVCTRECRGVCLKNAVDRDVPQQVRTWIWLQSVLRHETSLLLIN